MSDVKIKIDIITGQAQASLAQLNNSVNALAGSVERLNNNRSLNGFTSSIGGANQALNVFKGIVGANVFFALGVAIKEFVGGAVDEFARFETALIGVQKTTDITDKELETLGKEFRQLSTRIPVAADELAGLAQIAGQLGVRGSENLLKFSETLARLTRSTDIAGEAGATNFAKFLNVTRESVSDIDKFASVIVELGNNFATTEAPILELATEIGKSATVFNLSAVEVLGLSAALKALGVESDSGSTAIAKTFRKIQEAVVLGGAKLEEFARVAGVTSEQFVKSYREDSYQAFLQFVNGLAVQGDRSTIVLKNLELADERVAKTLLTLAANTDILADANRRANTELEKNQALANESNRAFTTLDSSLKTLQNTFAALTQEVFAGVGPALNNAAQGLTNILQYIRESRQLPESFQEASLEAITLRSNIRQLRQEIEASVAKDPTLNAFEERRQVMQALRLEQERLLKLQNKFGEDIGLKTAPGDLDKILGKKPSETAVSSDIDFAAIEERQKQSQARRSQATQEYFDKELSLTDAYDAAEKERTETRLLEIDITNQARFQKLEELIGKEEAAQIAARQAELQYEINQTKELDKQKELRLKGELDLQRRIKAAADKKAKEDEERNRFTVENTAAAFGNLATISAAFGKRGFEAQKAFSTGQAIILGAQAVQNAYATGGPVPLNLIAAAAMVARTAAQIRTIQSQRAPAFEDGGIVPGNSFNGDRVTARVNSGEMILNRAQQAQLFSIANGGDSGREIVVHSNVILDGEVVGKAVSRQVANGLVLGDAV